MENEMNKVYDKSAFIYDINRFLKTKDLDYIVLENCCYLNSSSNPAKSLNVDRDGLTFMFNILGIKAIIIIKEDDEIVKVTKNETTFDIEFESDNMDEFYNMILYATVEYEKELAVRGIIPEKDVYPEVYFKDDNDLIKLIFPIDDTGFIK